MPVVVRDVRDYLSEDEIKDEARAAVCAYITSTINKDNMKAVIHSVACEVVHEMLSDANLYASLTTKVRENIDNLTVRDLFYDGRKFDGPDAFRTKGSYLLDEAIDNNKEELDARVSELTATLEPYVLLAAVTDAFYSIMHAKMLG